METPEMKIDLLACPICNKPIDHDEDEATLICYACGFSWQADHKDHIKLYQAFPRRAGKWVKCSERLPDHYDLVLVTRRKPHAFFLQDGHWLEGRKDPKDEVQWYDGDPLADLGWKKK